VISVQRARRLVLALPEVAEQDHHGFPSFRVGGRIFATQPDARHFNIMLDESAIRAATGTDPDGCEELWWGTRLRGVRVDLTRIQPVLFADLVGDAWQRKAPTRLVSARVRGPRLESA
jgi:hypothetical protein